MTKKSSPCKKSARIPKRSLPPHLVVLYQQFKDSAGQLSQNAQQKQEAQRLLVEAQRRMDECAHQAATITVHQQNLERQVMQAELSLENDFTKHYHQLVQFQQTFGHCNVPTSSSSSSSSSHAAAAAAANTATETTNNAQQYHELAVWIKKMRRVKQMPESTSSKGDYYQGNQWKYYISALDRIGFVWDAIKDQWRSQFEKMLVFKASTGHCAIPKGYIPDKSLGAWRPAKNIEAGNTSRMGQED